MNKPPKRYDKFFPFQLQFKNNNNNKKMNKPQKGYDKFFLFQL